MNQSILQKAPDRTYTIALPCEPEDFAGFVSSLLGKPQTITNMEKGAFEIRKEDIINSYHLIFQRISQQNDAHLLQFNVRLVFDDYSSVLLNSLDDFIAYNEIRPIYPVQAHLSWSILLKFKDRLHPEKQEIDLGFVASGHHTLSFMEDDMSSVFMRGTERGGISFRIRHTARTWGADIESLLTGHARHLLLPESPSLKFARTHSGKIALLASSVFFLGTVAGCFFTAEQLALDQINSVSDLMNTAGEIERKVNRLLEMTAEGFWGKYFFAVLVFVVLSFFTSVILGMWVSSSAENYRPSYILITKKADQIKVEKDNRYRFRWFSFIGSIGTGIVVGIVSNIIFNKYWMV